MEFEITVTVEDYRPSGALVERKAVTFPVEEGEGHLGQEAAAAGGTFTTMATGSGNSTLAAPLGNSGRRTVSCVVEKIGTSPTVGYGTWYKLKNYTAFDWNKSTKKVSSVGTGQAVLKHDNLNDISEYSKTRAYYTYFSGYSGSGYTNKYQWKVARGFAGYTGYHYPHCNVFAHSDGSAYISWNAS